MTTPVLTSLAAFPQWAIGLMTVAFLFISLIMILIVLIQRPQGGGLSGAFGAGGGGSGQSAFGAKTGDALTIATVAVFVLFLIGAVALNFALRPTDAQQAAAEAAALEEGAAEVVDDGQDDSVTPDSQGIEIIDGLRGDDADTPAGEGTPEPTETPGDDEGGR